MKTVFNYIYRYYKQTDKLLWAACMAASVFSVTMLMGIANSGYVNKTRVVVQIIAVALGFAAVAVISRIDYNYMVDMWRLHSTATYILVMLTFVIGVARDDDRAWLPLPFGLTFQPSELLKISFILSFSLHLSKVRSNINEPVTLLGVLGHAMVPTALVFLQGDAGSALVFLFIAIVMIFCAGIDFKYVGYAVAAAVVASPLVWFFIMDEDKRRRVITVFNPELDPSGIGYQQRFGRIALGSGKMWGKGVFSGNHQYVPEMYNDFIFSFIGEALGFVGCLLAVGILAFICLRILNTGSKSKDHTGQYICIGIFSMLAFQSLANIGMCLSILPVIGITLPLFSGGGTSVVVTYMSIGVAMSVYMHNSRNLFIDK